MVRTIFRGKWAGFYYKNAPKTGAHGWKLMKENEPAGFWTFAFFAAG